MVNPNSCAFSNSGLSAFACMPKTMASKSAFIFSGNHPNSSGNNPFASNLDFEGSKITSSLPVILYPLCSKASAKLCMALPPIAIKCICIPKF